MLHIDYEEWVSAGHLDKDSNYGNPKYQRKYKDGIQNFANFLKRLDHEILNYTPEGELRKKKTKKLWHCIK